MREYRKCNLNKENSRTERNKSSSDLQPPGAFSVTRDGNHRGTGIFFSPPFLSSRWIHALERNQRHSCGTVELATIAIGIDRSDRIYGSLEKRGLCDHGVIGVISFTTSQLPSYHILSISLTNGTRIRTPVPWLSTTFRTRVRASYVLNAVRVVRITDDRRRESMFNLVTFSFIKYACIDPLSFRFVSFFHLFYNITSNTLSSLRATN